MGIGFEVSFPLAFLAGIISFLSPCTLPILPSFLAYLSGTSQEDHVQAQTVARGQMMLSALFLVVGFSLVFFLLGASISALG